MSMQTQIQRIRDAKEAMRLSIIAKGVDVPISAKIDTYPTYIAQIVRSRQHATFAVTDDITNYTSTEFVDVFDRATGKWYKLNNLNQFEPYGVYGTSPDDTKYVGKLIVYNGNEYEWTGSDWRYLGQVEGEEHTSDFTKQDIGNVIQTDVSVLEDGMYISILPYSLKGQISNSKALLGSNSSDRLSNLFSYTNVETISDSDIIDRSVWKLSSTGDANTYYVQNVATGKYFGYDAVTASKGLPLVDDANKVPVKFVVFTVNNVTAIGICKSGAPNDGYAINNLYSYNNRYNWFNTIAGASDLNNSFAIYKINSAYAVYPKEYAAIAIPTPPPASMTFNTMEDAIGYTYVYYGLRARIDGSPYVYNSNNEWEALSFAITGTKYGTNALSITINNVRYNTEVIGQVDENTYIWGLDWDVSIPITNITVRAQWVVTIDFSKADVSQWKTITHEAFYSNPKLESFDIPNSITSIGDAAFQWCGSLDLSGVPDSVTSIDRFAFRGIDKLTTFSMPNVTTLGVYALGDNLNLVSVSMPKMTSVPENTFYGDKSLTSVYMPNVTDIGNSAFDGCTSLALTELPSGITSIGGNAFNKCSSLALTELPSGITSIGGNAFNKCSSLALTELPSGVTSISNNTFEGCSSLALTELPSGITSIGNAAFSGCTSLALTELPSGITSISNNTFEGCTSLASISMPNVTSIGQSAFTGCTSLALTELPSGVTSISNNTFEGCSSLALTELPSGITSIGNAAFSGCTSLALTELPSGVTSIGLMSFSGCSSLASISMPNVTSIGQSAFEGCTSLASVSMPNVTNIDSSAFNYCTSLASVSMPNVTSIGQSAFSRCTSLASVEIPSGVTSIGYYAFNNCTALASVTCRATTPPTLGKNVFLKTSSSLVIYVPVESVEAYKTATNWSTYASKIQAITE